MTHRKFTGLILPWLIALALLFPLHGALMRARSQQLAAAVNDWDLTRATTLEEAGAIADLNTNLRLQIQRGDVAGVEAVLAQGADVNFQDDVWSSPLSFAVACGSVPLVETLIRHGADVNLQDKVENRGTTALITAAIYKRAPVVQALLAAGARVNTRTFSGNTALDAARDPNFGDLRRDQRETIAILKQAGAIAGNSQPLDFEKQRNSISAS
ncbi:MAG: ankyrin repeat domain-containing protein [Abitibacteriaceae bacterium]|nr:ankyrin repeat domain-containing protein [Abditibacteriaceae bacterium]